MLLFSLADVLSFCSAPGTILGAGGTGRVMHIPCSWDSKHCMYPLPLHLQLSCDLPSHPVSRRPPCQPHSPTLPDASSHPAPPRMWMSFTRKIINSVEVRTLRYLFIKFPNLEEHGCPGRRTEQSQLERRGHRGPDKSQCRKPGSLALPNS